MSCVNSSNDLLRFMCFNLNGDFVQSLLICVNMANLPFDSLYRFSNRNLFKGRLLNFARDRATDEEIIGADAIKELCDIRDGLLIADFVPDEFLLIFTL